jgi:hypothetical protein
MLREYLLIPNTKLNNLIYLRKIITYIIDHINEKRLKHLTQISL